MSPAPKSRREPAAVAAALSDWLRERSADPAATIVDIARPAGAGLSNETFLIELATAQGRESLALQVGPAGAGLFRDYDLVLMARVQQRLAVVSDVPVAPVRWVEADTAVLGAPFYVMSCVAGQVPSDNPAYHATGWFAEAPATVQRGAWLDGIAALVRLHALDAGADGFHFLVDAPWGMQVDAAPAETRVGQWRRFLAWGAHAPVPLIEHALDTLARTAPPPTRPRVSWGDAKISNCVIEEGRVRALLDWELCGLSDPHEDLAHWLLLDWAHWRTQGHVRLPALPTPRESVAHYESLAGHAMPHTLWWFQLSFVRLAVIYHRFLERRIALGRLDADADLGALNPMSRHLDEVLAMEELP